MTGDRKRRKTAAALLAMRKMRCELFPAEIFDEHAWTMLLQIFVSLADNQTMTEDRLISLSGVSLKTGRLWIKHLVVDEQIEARSDGDDVILTPKSITAMRRFLDLSPIEPQDTEMDAGERGASSHTDWGGWLGAWAVQRVAGSLTCRWQSISFQSVIGVCAMELDVQTVASLRTIVYLLDQAITLADERNLTGVAARLSGARDAAEHKLEVMGAPPLI
jgi:hypothetical protein